MTHGVRVGISAFPTSLESRLMSQLFLQCLGFSMGHFLELVIQVSSSHGLIGLVARVPASRAADPARHLAL